jgi:adenosylhomocysteine nucleosidase
MAEQFAIIAALPREIAGLVRGARPDATLLRSGIHRYRLPGAVVVAAGMGSQRAALAVESAMAAAPVRCLLSTGLAGSCTSALQAGDVAEASVVVDVRTGERFFSSVAMETPCLLATADIIASVREKARLGAGYQASMVDMEAATVARLARAHGLEFRAIKAISDGPAFEMESLGKFAGRHGSFRTGAFALHTAMRPWTWAKAMELGRGSAAALKALEQELRVVVASGAA